MDEAACDIGSFCLCSCCCRFGTPDACLLSLREWREPSFFRFETASFRGLTLKIAMITRLRRLCEDFGSESPPPSHTRCGIHSRCDCTEFFQANGRGSQAHEVRAQGLGGLFTILVEAG